MTVGHSDHLVDQVHPCDALGDGVLHLQPRVHLQEVEVPLGVTQELHGASTVVANGLGQLHRLLSHGCSGAGVQEGRGSLLYHLLVPSLDAALSLIQMNGVTMFVTQHLNLNVTRRVNKLLYQHSVIPKGRGSLFTAESKCQGCLLIIPGYPHSLATTASTGLHHDRVANLSAQLDTVVHILYDAIIPGDTIDPGLCGQPLAGQLVTHVSNGRAVRSNELDAGLLQLGHKHGVLRQEAISRMDSLSSCVLDGLEDLLHDQVGFSGRSGTNVDSLVCHLDKQPHAVCHRVNCYCLDTHLSTCSYHPACNLSSVGYQHFSKGWLIFV